MMVKTESALLESPRLAALQAELAAGVPNAEGQFWDEVESLGTPLAEFIDDAADGLWVTFLWRETPEEPVDHVAIGEFFSPGDPGEKPLARLGRSSVWFRTYRMKRGLRAEYAFWVNDVLGPLRGSDDIEARLDRLRRDPLNAAHTAEPWMTFPEGSERNDSSVFALPGAEPFVWKVWRDVPHGVVTEHTVRSEILDNERTVWTHEPPNRDASVEPMVLIQFDGDRCIGTMGLPAVLDNLHAAGKVRPIIGLFVGNVDRGKELPCNASFADFLADELLPWARTRFGIAARPEQVIAAGQSYGGLAAAWVGLTRPDAVGHVISQSGSFWWLPNPEQVRSSSQVVGAAPLCGWLPHQVAGWEPVATRFSLEAGTLEAQNSGVMPSLLSTNRHMRDVLLARGHDVTYREYQGGHEYSYWGELIADALQRHAGVNGTT